MVTQSQSDANDVPGINVLLAAIDERHDDVLCLGLPNTDYAVSNSTNHCHCHSILTAANFLFLVNVGKGHVSGLGWCHVFWESPIV